MTSLPHYRVRVPVEEPLPDAPGYNLKPDLATITTPGEFMDALRWLHSWAGEPPMRELSRRCGGAPSPDTFGKMLKSETLPPLELLLAFVDALGLAVDRGSWRAAWVRVRTPVRIQRRRSKGWRLPEGAVCVGRPSRWGNPILIGGPYEYRTPAGLVVTGYADTHADAVAAHRVYLTHHPELCAAARGVLAGRDLACWCPLVDSDGRPVPCHADNWLTIANCPSPATVPEVSR